MKLRFHEGHVHFDPGLIIPPQMSQEEAAAHFYRGDTKALIEGQMWLAVDIASRVLHKLGLPAYRGEELTAEGLLAIVEAVDRLKECPHSIRAYLSQAIENRISEYLDTDKLCYVPPRTQRDHWRRGKGAKSPGISLATDLAYDDETHAQVLNRLGRSYDTDQPSPEDVYEFCEDETDRDIIDLRYDDGAGPRAMAEVAKLAGVSRNTVLKRLANIENRMFPKDEEKEEEKKPTPRRSPGKRFFGLPVNRRHLAESIGGEKSCSTV